MKLAGRVWKYGDGLSATDIVPAAYDPLTLVYDWDRCAEQPFEENDPGFGPGAAAGDVIIAGRALGAGHAHYHVTAIMACRFRGIGAILCESADMLFQRAGIDHGLPIWPVPGIGALFDHGDPIAFDLISGNCRNTTTGIAAQFTPLPPLVPDILAADSSLHRALARAAAGHQLNPSS